MAAASSSVASTLSAGKFSVLVSGLRDPKPHSPAQIPSGWLHRLLIDLGLGKMRVNQPFEIESRYSKGCPRQYFLRVRVFFDATINQTMRKTIENGHTAKIVYAQKGEPHYITGKPISRDKFLTIEPDTIALQKKRAATASFASTQKMKQVERHQKMAKKKVATSSPKNAFAALAVDDNDTDDDE